MSTALADPPTATATATANGQANGAAPIAQPQQALAPLWPANIKIPFIAVTGEYGTGKTLFGLLIDPERCVHFDFEGSAATYESGLPFVRVDMQELARQKFKSQRYRPSDLFVLWRERFLSMPPGRFRVCVIDDASSLEDGIVEYVRAHPAEFGYTVLQFQKSEAMLWGAVKAYYKQIMLAAGIECCVFVTHMRAQFAGNRPTGKREAKGKETIMELASLYLMLDRKPDADGKVPAKPNAIKLKDRLSTFQKNPETGEFEARPVLPPRIAQCSPDRIRFYIANPPNYDRLKKAELILPEQMSEDERLILQAQIAADQKETEAARANNQAAVNEAARIRMEAMQMAPGVRAQDQSAQVAADVGVKAEAAAVASSQSVEQIETVNQELQPVAGAESPHPAEVPAAGAPDVQQTAPATPPTSLPASFDSTSGNPDPITPEQLEELRLFKVERLKIPSDVWKKIMAKRGVTTAKALTFDQADQLLAALDRKWVSEKQSRELDQWSEQQKGWARGQVAKNLASGQQPPAGTTQVTTPTVSVQHANGEVPF